MGRPGSLMGDSIFDSRGGDVSAVWGVAVEAGECIEYFASAPLDAWPITWYG